ncbi:MAG TPA: 30S ribosomal protein S5 [Candidatus Bathyarchaeia archaeon]|nr:30S ribosomal protein S5 [Candidatus Bathyarchaeia archaeon]
MAQALETQRSEAGWIPKTKVGRMVQGGQIVTLEDIFTQGLKIKEPEIVDVLLPGLKQEVLGIGFVQKQTDAGEKSRFKAIVAVGNGTGFLGIGGAKAKQVRSAIDKATLQAKLDVVPLRRGCGSWECGCGQAHSLPFRVRGKCGSVAIEIIPGPRGLGLVGGETPKTVLTLAGVKDCWTRSFGSTSTLGSMAFAVYEALRSTYGIVAPKDWVA